MAKHRNKSAPKRAAVQQRRSSSQKARNTTTSGRGRVTSKPGKKSSLPSGKLGSMIKLLSRPEGATLTDLTKVTGWQPHSVRGALSGTIKKKLGLALTSQKADGDRTYRIEQ